MRIIRSTRHWQPVDGHLPMIAARKITELLARLEDFSLTNNDTEEAPGNRIQLGIDDEVKITSSDGGPRFSS